MADRVGAHRPVLAVVDELRISHALDPYFSLKALAVYSSISVTKLRSFINDLPPEQCLPCYRLTGKILVRRSAFDSWMEQYRARGRPSLVKALQELGLMAPQPHGQHQPSPRSSAKPAKRP